MPAKQVKIRRGTTVEHSVFVGEIGEITVDTTKDTLVIHDKSTQGGNPLAKEDMTNVFNRVGIQQLNVDDGTNGQYLTTDGSGSLSFTTDSTNVSATTIGGDLSGTISNAQIIADVVGINELNITGAAGTNGQFLQTDGSGNLQFGSSVIDPNTIGVDELNLPDGTANQVLTTDGNKNISFQTPVTNPTLGGDLSGTTSNAQIKTGVVGISELAVSDGTTGQILSTNGSGILSFVDDGGVSGGGGNLNFIEDEMTGDGTSTTFTYPSGTIVTDKLTMLVYVDGVSQALTAYTLATTTSIGISPAPHNGAKIKVLHLGVFAGGTTASGSTVLTGDVIGTISNTSIPNNSITAAKIAPGVIVAQAIATNAVGITELNVDDGTTGQVLSTNGSGVLSFVSSLAGGTGLTGMQVFDTAGAFTWTRPAGVRSILYFVTGGGGGVSPGGNSASAPSGGGGGATAMGFLDVINLASETGTVGVGGAGNGTTQGATGGTTTFGSIITALGGQGGGLIGGISNGLGGTATGGQLNMPGGVGQSSSDINSSTKAAGGVTFFAAIGSGARGHNGGTSPGNIGNPGVVVILEFA